MVKEWNFLRVFACLSIVFLHSTTRTIIESGAAPNIENYEYIRVLLTYATPTFILLAEIILANKYKDSIPNNFFRKRIKYIIGPFIAFAFLDMLVSSYLTSGKIDPLMKVWRNLQGAYEGYFILVIFQFYILHYLIVRYKVPMRKLVFPSIVIMLIYLSVINNPDINIATEHRFRLKLPFLAWMGYFSVAYVIGTNYEIIAKYLKRYKWVTLIIVYYAGYLVYQSFETGIRAINSIRLDIFPLSIAMTLALLAWGQVIPNNRLINLISNYSLGIYLLHWPIQRLIQSYTVKYFSGTLFSVFMLFILSIILSMVIIYLMSLLPFGKYIVGNTRRKYSKG